jgi:CubicO group peptidase (beta-lactamase class C family)
MAVEIDASAAVTYAASRGAEALVIARNDTIVEAWFAEGWSADRAHALYSGTKSFWGPAAVSAQEDGLLQLDEPVADTIEQWRADPQKSRVTLRMLLSLTAGYGFGGLGASVPPYDRALAIPLKNVPGTRFTYGGIPLQAFGAVLACKLTTRGSTPHEYLRERVLKPAGVAIDRWKELPNGTHPLPTGAFVSANNWLAYGRYIVLQCDRFAECFHGSHANAKYGLGWWLGAKSAPSDLVYASGSGGQALYVVPSLSLVIVRFARKQIAHEPFLKRLFSTEGTAR